MPVTHRKAVMLTLLVPVLAQCVTVAPPPQTNDPDACGAETISYLVGTQVGAADLTEGPLLRIIAPGDFVTEDYRPERLNVFIDENATISRLECG